MIRQQCSQVKLGILRLVSARSFEYSDNLSSGVLDYAGIEDAHLFPALFSELIEPRVEKRLIK